MKKIVIFGTGKLAQKLVAGFVLAQERGKLLADIVVIGRNKEKLETFLRFQNVRISEKYDESVDADFLILCITPQGVHDLYSKIGIFFKKEGYPKTIVSLASGADQQYIATLLGMSQSDIVCGTTNTNIAFNEGCSLFTGSSEKITDATELFDCLGKTYVVSGYGEVLNAIGTIGSANAFDAVFLWELMQFQKKEKPEKVLESVMDFLLNGSEIQSIVDSYLTAKVQHMLSLGYEEVFARNLAKETMISTCRALLQNPIDENSISLHIKSVATEGGCTAQGILAFKNELHLNVFKSDIPNFIGFSERYQSIMLPVYQRIQQFEKDVLS